MFYNIYTLERMAHEIQNDKIREAKQQNRWSKTRKALNNLQKPRSDR